MRAILVGASPELALSKLRALRLKRGPGRRGDLLIGVDGGAFAFAKLGLQPDLIVGDWDSADWQKPAARKLFAETESLSLSRAKDRSDLHHALQAAMVRGAREIHAFGVTGGRPDHQLASLYELSQAAQGLQAPVHAYDNSGEYLFLSGRQSVKFRPAYRTLSVFALGAPARGVTLRGVLFPLKNAVLEPSSHGLSNAPRTLRGSRSLCQISLISGSLVVISS